MRSTGEALEEIGVMADPLEIVAAIGDHGLEDWRLVECLGCFSVLSLGCPITDFILCWDHSGERECVRFDVNGRETARVVGPRLSRQCLVTDPDRMVRMLHQYEEAERFTDAARGEINGLARTEAC